MDNPTYLSERENADRNWAITYFLKESNVFPKNTDIKDVMDFYLQQNSISCNTKMLAALAATYANQGINPLTEE